MIAAGNPIKGAKVNVLGLTFKENCGDLRNPRSSTSSMSSRATVLTST